MQVPQPRPGLLHTPKALSIRFPGAGLTALPSRNTNHRAKASGSMHSSSGHASAARSKDPFHGVSAVSGQILRDPPRCFQIRNRSLQGPPQRTDNDMLEIALRQHLSRVAGLLPPFPGKRISLLERIFTRRVANGFRMPEQSELHGLRGLLYRHKAHNPKTREREKRA